MATPFALKWGSVSITGNYRENNEDRCHVDSGGRYFLVADGMGGQSAGEKASELAIELIASRLDRSWPDIDRGDAAQSQSAIDSAIGHANGEIMALGELEARYRSMGTTITYIVRAGGSLLVGNVGDSRTYLLRGGRLERLTKDHSLTQALLDAGTISAEEAATHRYKNVLYRYLGTKEGGQGTDARTVTPQRGDRLMMCSDGVTDGCSEDTIAGLLAEEADPQKAAERIVDAALNGGSRDNITCLVVHVA
ncbi:MAG: serine/threonine-protein phosphatase [Planctomyces sp.]|nr:serine/threonine-protein phosphatase [Planctomyces sp.]